MSIEAIEKDKQKTIARAAFEVFAEHGFRKTSMQLIAEKAGMSRPALYLHFQSKEDVFRFLSNSYLTKVAADIDAVLVASGPPVEVLQSVFDAFDPNGMKAVLLDAKHGDELMEVNETTVNDFADDIGARIRVALRKWLEREATQGHIHCDDPDMTSQTIMSSYFGLKNPKPSYADYKSRTKQLAQMLGRGLTA
jgi:AcrR family transcriptional regulator